MTSRKLSSYLYVHNISVLLMLPKYILSRCLDASDEGATLTTIDGIVNLFQDVLEIEMCDQN